MKHSEINIKKYVCDAAESSFKWDYHTLYHNAYNAYNEGIHINIYPSTLRNFNVVVKKAFPEIPRKINIVRKWRGVTYCFSDNLLVAFLVFPEKKRIV